MITIATPMYGGVASAYYIDSLLKNILYLKEKNIDVQWKFLTQESLIPRARNELVRQFLETDDQYLMFIDADINFPPEAIYKLISHNKELIVGIYPKKQIYWEGIKSAVLNNVKDFWNFGCSFVFNAKDNLEENQKPLIDIEHGATGFMCIHRSVFLNLKDKVSLYRTSDFSKYQCYNFFDTSIHNGLYLSEDYHFSNLWKQFGGKIFADTSIKLDHVGIHIFTGDLLKAGKNTT